MKSYHLILLTSLLLIANFNLTFASDHIDGPVTTAHGVGDISDLYIFKTPNAKNHLSLVLNAYPLAPSKAHFSKKVNYEIILKRVVLNKQEMTYSKGVKITCRFDNDHSKDAKAKCSLTNGLSAQSVIGEMKSTGDFKLYAGMRSDPFFLNGDWVTNTINDGKLTKEGSDNTMAKLNVLSIVIDIETNKLFKDYKEGLIAVAARSLTRDKGASTDRQLDWIGRPEITNFSLVHNGKEDLRDSYNQEFPFTASNAYKRPYQKRLFENILFHYDDQDGVNDWNDKKVNELVSILLKDHILIDPTKKCSGDHYLEIELAILKGEAYESCGGRKLGDDIVDRLLSLYVTSKLNRLRDGVDSPYRKTTQQFPYLVAPDLSRSAKLKAWLARQFN